MPRNRQWFDGTTLLAVMMERYAKGEAITITREEVEAMNFGTSMPIMFEIASQDGNSVRIKVVRRGDIVEPGEEIMGSSDADPA